MAKSVEKELNVENAEGFEYKAFIDKLRSEYFAVDVRDEKQLQILKQFQYNYDEFVNTKFGGKLLDIVLKTCSSRIKLWINLRRFSVVGYHQMVAECGTYSLGRSFEFGHQSGRTRSRLPDCEIYGSSPLQLRGLYCCIMGEIGAGLTFHNMIFGRQQLTTAVNYLASVNPEECKEIVAWSLIVVMVMISEAVRFPSVGEALSSTFSWGGRLGPFLVNSVTQWEGCAPFEIAKHIPGIWGYPMPLHDKGNDCSRCQLLLGYCLTEQDRSLPCEGTADTLLELLSVHVDEIKRQGQFYGKISLFVGNNLEHVYYNRGEAEEFVQPGEDLLLTGPNGSCIPVDPDDGARFILELFGYVALDTFTDAQICWPKETYDEVLSPVFDTDDCCLTLNYIVLERAVQVTLGITFMGVACGILYGKICARTPKFGTHSVILFQKEDKDKFQVSEGQRLELLRTVVAVPLGCSLLLDVGLYDNTGELVVAEDTIAVIPDEYSVPSQEDFKEICGDSGGIRVKVNWK